MKKAVFTLLVLALLLPLCPSRVFGYNGSNSVIVKDADRESLWDLFAAEPFWDSSGQGIPAGGGVADGIMQWSGSIPYVEITDTASMPNREYLIYQINDRLREICLEKLRNASDSYARSITFRYEYKPWYNYGSVLLYITTVLNQTKEEVISVNFDIGTGMLIGIRDVLGMNAIALVNAAVQDEIRKAPDSFNVGFSGVGSEADFYVEDGRIQLLFDKYEIAPGSRGIVGIGININSVKTFTISYLDYLTKPSQYELKLVPLNLICDILGYRVVIDERNEYSKIIDAYKNDTIVTCIVGENSYYRLGDPPKSLEAPPEIYFDSVYVPVSFIEQMLGASYTIDYEDNIIISYFE